MLNADEFLSEFRECFQKMENNVEICYKTCEIPLQVSKPNELLVFMILFIFSIHSFGRPPPPRSAASWPRGRSRPPPAACAPGRARGSRGRPARPPADSSESVRVLGFAKLGKLAYSVKFCQIFGGLVLGCIKTKFGY